MRFPDRLERAMLGTVWGVVRQGRVELLEAVQLPEGTRLLVTVLPDDEAKFWNAASRVSIDAIWDNTDDDVYAHLLEA